MHTRNAEHKVSQDMTKQFKNLSFKFYDFTFICLVSFILSYAKNKTTTQDECSHKFFFVFWFLHLSCVLFLIIFCASTTKTSKWLRLVKIQWTYLEVYCYYYCYMLISLRFVVVVVLCVMLEYYIFQLYDNFRCFII